MSSSPHTIVITGGNGFVGGYLHQELSNAWPDAHIVSWDLPSIDITKPDTYVKSLQELQPDWVIHLAAIASVPFAIQHPDTTFAVNTEGTKVLIESIQSHSPATHMLFISTADIYGAAAQAYEGKRIPELALQDVRPVNVYAESKRDAEISIENTFNNKCIRVRPFPHIGPGQGLGFVSSDFASQIAAIEAGKQEAVLRVGNLTAERDFTDVRDVVRAYRLLIEQGTLGEVYHVASGKSVPIQTLLDILLAKSSATISIVQDDERMRPSDIPVLVGDATKLQQATGWKPAISLEQSLEDVLNWWRSNGAS